MRNSKTSSRMDRERRWIKLTRINSLNKTCHISSPWFASHRKAGCIITGFKLWTLNNLRWITLECLCCRCFYYSLWGAAWLVYDQSFNCAFPISLDNHTVDIAGQPWEKLSVVGMIKRWNAELLRTVMPKALDMACEVQCLGLFNGKEKQNIV